MRLSFLLGCLAVINILLSLSYHWFLFTTLGAGSETDALFAAMVVPQFLLAAVSGMLGTVFVPLLTTERRSDFQRLAWTFTQGVGLKISMKTIVTIRTIRENACSIAICRKLTIQTSLFLIFFDSDDA